MREERIQSTKVVVKTLLTTIEHGGRLPNGGI